MQRSFPKLWLGLAALLVPSLGCSMCTTSHIYDYAGAGGKWQRGNPTCGRVGSIMSDAGASENGHGAGFGEHYGDSWGLIDGEPTPAAEMIPEMLPGDMESTEIIQDDSSIMLEPGSIMIGP